MDSSLLEEISKDVTNILSAQNRDELSLLLQQSVFRMGLATYNLSVGKNSPREFMYSPTLTSWSQADLTRYEQDKWFDRDPLLAYAGTRASPIMWDLPDVDQTSHREYFDYLRSVGVRGGITVPLTGSTDDVSAFTMLHVEDEELHADVLHAATIIARVAKVQIARIGAERTNVPDTNVALYSLSSEQLTILSWVSRGKSNSDIAIILNRSRRSVDYHTSEILRKLGVSSRTEAAAIFAAEMRAGRLPL